MSVQLNLPKNCIDKKFVICSREIGGMGDLVCGLRFAYILEKAGISTQNILIATNNLEAMAFLNQKRFTIISLQEVSQIQNVALQIFAPKTDNLRLSELISGVPILVFQEYGYRNEERFAQLFGGIENYSLGLSVEDGDIGIPLDDTLLNWSQGEVNSKDRVKKLKLLSEGLQKLIFDGCEDEQVFAEKKLLYFGYARKSPSHRSFVEAIATLNKYNQKDVIIVLPGASLHPDFQFNLDISIKNAGFSTIIFPDWKIRKKLDDRKDGKTLTIIQDSVNRQDIMYLHMGAEKEKVVTGDQSLTEAISSASNFVYESMHHKENLTKDLQNIYGDVTFFPVDAEQSCITRKMLQIFQENSIQFQEAHERVWKELDCKGKVLDLVQKSLETTASIPLLPSTYPKSSSIKNFPINQPMILEASQIGQLNIAYGSNKSSLQEFSDSIFEYEILGSCSYLVTRKLIETPVETHETCTIQ